VSLFSSCILVILFYITFFVCILTSKDAFAARKKQQGQEAEEAAGQKHPL
jgi:hypothetical protein